MTGPGGPGNEDRLPGTNGPSGEGQQLLEVAAAIRGIQLQVARARQRGSLQPEERLALAELIAAVARLLEELPSD